MLEGLPNILELVAGYAGVVTGSELRRTRAMGPAIAMGDWAAHDAEWTDDPSD